MKLTAGEARSTSLERNAKQPEQEKTRSVQGRSSGKVRKASAGKDDDGEAVEDLRLVDANADAIIDAHAR